ncbi:cysteine desulfurase family protein (TIGR01976 family) [Actinoplanes campanulatus]|uniref:Cysteine desulfurase family protein (TIGR01976 family) n=1 Tax=Actinoplanes campanulatus TaxID=113559 RepID=A0A7W5AL18_9ACTN|nr:cysteine desulfurase-like protein [Actinoplanes campanulatus]MBB3098032.1 cysteine desulfurase family protein (TIGR01976 family) [Actinoplanes campanulatus]GGN32018.1 cysteine desulfurase-like protein [Actinoplanes campanulatus]GID40096.1 cysteine desulfurase-like protein [Actinoplanes campanulatus]
MSIDVTALRAHFPSLAGGLAFFDGPGGTQTPRPVADAITATLTGPLSNRGTVSVSELNAERAVAEFRAAYADLLGVPATGVVHGRSATQLTYDFSRHLAKTWRPGDEIVVSRLDHDSNVRPWIQAAERSGVTVRWIGIDPETTELDLGSYERALSSRTRLVAVTAASNVLGTVPPLRRIADLAHDAGALVYADGVHYAAHHLVDVAALGADMFVCSPYKFLGPHCGVLAADPALLATLRPDKLVPSPDTVPERFEFGTLPYEMLAGATAAVDFLAAIDPGPAAGRRERLAHSLRSVHEHETALRGRVEAGLRGLGDLVTLHSRAGDRTPTLLMDFGGRDAREAQTFLAGRDVLAPAGSFYAHEPFAALKLTAPALRVGLAAYNTAGEVDRLLDGLTAWLSR